MNKVFIIGNLGSDPEMRFTPQGKAVTSFNVADNYFTGEKKETTWFKVTCWGKVAERCNEKLNKGDRVLVDGSIRLNSWDSNDGKTHTQMVVNAASVEIITAKGKETSQRGIEPEDLPF